MAYSTKDDLLIGDIPLSARFGDGTAFVEFAADEIDSFLGHIYVTPINLSPTDPATAPARKLLKKINILLASGRIILDMAAGGEDDSLHAYGRLMLNEGTNLLKQIADERIKLIGAEKIAPSDVTDQNTAVSITNEDPYSLVEGFYDRYSAPSLTPPVPMRPYDKRV